jgi:peroxiredoxin 2/4
VPPIGGDILQEDMMNIGIGRKAPAVRALAYVRGARGPQTVDLRDFLGTWTVLFLYPSDFSDTAPAELGAFAESAGELASLDARVVAVSSDSYWSHRAWFESSPVLAQVSYPIVADTARTVASAFGVMLENGAAQRATFVIDAEGVLRHASISDSAVGSSVDETIRVVRALRGETLAPAERALLHTAA